MMLLLTSRVPAQNPNRHALRSAWCGLVSVAVVIASLAITQTAALAAPGPNASIGGLTAKFVDVKGVKTRYYDAGQGVPMVMIHGGSTAGSSTANVFSRNIPGLAKRFHVYAVDRLGSGLTGNPSNDADYATPGQVEHIYQFIQTLKLGKIHLVGHSAGGAVAFYLAVQHPEIVTTLTIIGQGPENPPAADGPTRLDLSSCPDQTVYDGLKCRVEKLAWLPTAFDPEYWEADTSMAMTPKSKEARAKVVALTNDAWRAASVAYRQQAWDKCRNDGALKMPVLIYSGKQDVLDWGKADPTAMMRGELGLFDIIGAKNTKVKMVILNEAGHFPYREYPEQFNADLITFIDHYIAKGAPAAKPAGKPGV
ncbi:MAG: alpha/beta hydrolase [Acidobacteriota bacterium]